jgi:hypothetical protein
MKKGQKEGVRDGDEGEKEGEKGKVKVWRRPGGNRNVSGPLC